MHTRPAYSRHIFLPVNWGGPTPALQFQIVRAKSHLRHCYQLRLQKWERRRALYTSLSDLCTIWSIIRCLHNALREKERDGDWTSIKFSPQCFARSFFGLYPLQRLNHACANFFGRLRCRTVRFTLAPLSSSTICPCFTNLLLS